MSTGRLRATVSSVSRRGGIFSIAAAAIVVACVLAWRAAWTCDDALITFRYVRHWVIGDGLVFNTGERVEGFSNFLFVLLLAPPAAANADLYIVANVLGVAALAVQIALLAYLLRRAPIVVVGFAAALLATDRIAIVWATGGLETAVHGALVMTALVLQIEKPERLRTLAGVHAALAASRPEGIIFTVIWIADLAISRRADLRRALNWLVPLVAVLVAARLVYYGELVANPYRAKVDGVPVMQFGPGYALAFLKRMGLFGVTALATLPLVGLAIRNWRAADRTLLLAFAFVTAQLVAIGASGGDYMTDFRLLAPVVAPFYVMIACIAVIVWRYRTLAVVAIAVYGGGHAYRQLRPVPVFATAPAPAQHKQTLTIAPTQPTEFARAIATFAEPGDSILADWAGYMSYGHELRVIDATGLLSKHIERDFYLRPSGERLPGHARWPTTEFMQREQFTFIFPKLTNRPPEDREITERSPARRRDYPFLHVTVPVGGQYLRFFTTLTPDELTHRAHGVAVCFRPAFGALTCVPAAAPRAPATH